MDGFVASVVIAALAIIALGLFGLASLLTFTCAVAPGGLAIFAAIRRA
jgi:hypothetical protein